VPRPLPLLCGLLHAPALARPGPAASGLLGGVRAPRRGADPALDPGGARGAVPHPPDRVHPSRAADGRADVRDLPGRLGGCDRARGAALPDGAPGQAARCTAPADPARARGGAAAVSLVLADLGLRTAVKYVAAAYLIVWLVTILWVSIVQSKLRRMERQIEA